MRSPRLLAGLAATAAVLGTTLAVAPTAAGAGNGHEQATGAKHTFLVLAEQNASRSETEAAIHRSGGQVVSANQAIGLYQVSSRVQGFERSVRSAGAVRGAARNRVIGKLPDTLAKSKRVEQENRGQARAADVQAGPTPGPTEGMDPLDEKLYGLRMVHSDTARRVNAGDSRVLVGVLDSGIDVRNPDLPSGSTCAARATS